MNPHLDQVGTLVKSVNGNKQLLAQMVQQGHVPHDIALLAGMRIDRLSKPQGNPGQQPTVLEKQFAPQQQQQQMAPQGLAQLQQPQMPMPQQAPQMPPQMQQAPVQAADGGLMQLPVGDMFNEASYAGGGIIAFDEGGGVPGFAKGAYLSSPVGKYFNPNDLTPYDDAEIQRQLLLNPDKSIEQIRDEQTKMRGLYGIKNLAAEQRAELDKDRAENEAFRSRIGAEAGLAAAAGLLGNTSQYFGPGAKAGIENYLTTSAAGQKEYKATAKDIRNMGFEIGQHDQAMRQAEMSGDQAMYNSERTRRDGLLKQAQDVKFKNVEQKNALLTKGADAAAGYKSNVDVADIRERGEAGRAATKNKSDLYNKAVDNAISQMSKLYPLGAQDPKFGKIATIPGKTYQDSTNAYNSELKSYIDKNISGMAAELKIDPSDIINAGGAAPTDTVAPKTDTMAKPADTTVTGKIPKVTSDAQYLKLAPGAEYLDPNGQRRRKPAAK
jgi:hypothetical protein